MKSDSVIYNSESDVARFFDNSEIWNSDGDYLCADEGLYDKAQDLYTVTRNGYVLTPERELWGDTLSYYRSRGHVVARRNIQMDDFGNKMLAFGDFAEYWSEAGNAVLTRDPSVVGYDTEQGDSVFLRADSMLLFTVSRFEPAATADSLTADAPAAERRISSVTKPLPSVRRTRLIISRGAATRMSTIMTKTTSPPTACGAIPSRSPLRKS